MGNTQNSVRDESEPMRIHEIHGANLDISEENLVASRKGGFCDAVFLGSRLYKHGEKLEITIRKMEEKWNGTIRYGFTVLSPSDLQRHPEGFPRYSIPDLSKRTKCYIDTYTSNKYKTGDVITFWINDNDDVIIKLNNFPLNHSIDRVPKAKFWPVIDVYGNVFEVKFRSLADDYIYASKSPCCRFYASLDLFGFPILNYCNDSVELINSNVIKKKEAINKAYCWNQYPLYSNQIWIVFVKECNEGAYGSLDIGIASQNPNLLLKNSPVNLSNISNITLLEKVYTKMNPSDELAICILNDGQVQVALNGRRFELACRLNVPQESIRNCPFWIIADLTRCTSVFSLESVGLFQLKGPTLPPMPTAYVNLTKISKFDHIRQLLVPESITEEIINETVEDSSEHIAIPEDEGDINESDDEMRQALQESLRSYEIEKRRESGITIMESSSLPVVPPSRSLLTDSECVICMDEMPTCAFIPCGHLVTCMACAENLQNEHKRECPACRKPIRSSQRVIL